MPEAWIDVRIQGRRVLAEYLGESQRCPGYVDVRYQGRRYTRRALVPQGSVQTTTTACVPGGPVLAVTDGDIGTAEPLASTPDSNVFTADFSQAELALLHGTARALSYGTSGAAIVTAVQEQFHARYRDNSDQDSSSENSLDAWQDRYTAAADTGSQETETMQPQPDGIETPALDPGTGTHPQPTVPDPSLIPSPVSDPAPVQPDAPSPVTAPLVDDVFSVSERFGFIADMVNMIVAGTSTSLVVTGSGGLGKTYTVMQALSDADLGEGTDYALIKGYATARSMYSRLHSENGKVVVFDDCDSVLDDHVAVNILKSALDTTRSRTVSWYSDRDSSVPSAFRFTGRIIFISNKSLAKIPQPILSRSLFVDVTMTTAEKLERIRQILPKLKPELGIAQKHEVLDLVSGVASRIHDLNIRTFLKACDIRSAALPETPWRRLATYVLITQSRAVPGA